MGGAAGFGELPGVPTNCSGLGLRTRAVRSSVATVRMYPITKALASKHLDVVLLQFSTAAALAERYGYARLLLAYAGSWRAPSESVFGFVLLNRLCRYVVCCIILKKFM